MTYRFYGYEVPGYTFEAMQAYVNEGRPVGHFLTAVIENNLTKACQYADEENLRNLPAIVGWFYNRAPSECWGSPQKYDAWLRMFAIRRAEALGAALAEGAA